MASHRHLPPPLTPPLLPLEDTPLYAKMISWGVMAGIGGAVKFVSAALKNNQVMSAKRFMTLLTANVFISGFSGLMGSLVFATFSPDHNLQLIAAGVFGYLGTHGLEIIALSMTRRVTNEAPPISSVIPVPASVDPAASQAKP